jgi:hypothetical protein
MSEEETAEVLKSSPRTVRRDWQFAKAWLHHELSGASGRRASGSGPPVPPAPPPAPILPPKASHLT